MSVALLIIDPQIDFCDPAGALPVPGAAADIERLARMIRAKKDRIDSIHVTLDSHHLLHIANPPFWRDAEGRHPVPFTRISRTDVEGGAWSASLPGMREAALKYVRRLEANGRYELTIWPPHCLIGSRGHAVAPELFEALLEFERGGNVVNYIQKGSNILTEHYSALIADVPDPAAPETLLNRRLLESLENADVVGIAGEARSHCVANTVRDLAAHLDPSSDLERFVLIEDAMSDIPGFEGFSRDFMAAMLGRGMRLGSTDSFEDWSTRLPRD